MTADVTDKPQSLANDGAMTIQEAVSFLRVSRSEVYLLMGRGELRSSRVGRRRLVLRRSAVELLERGMTDPVK